MEDNLGLDFAEIDQIDIQDEMPVPKEEVVDIKADEDLDIIEEYCHVNPNSAKRWMPNKFKRKLHQSNGNHLMRKQPTLDFKEEIVISDSSDSENGPSTKRTSNSKRKNQDDSLSSIILNCPKCNETKTVFSTTLANECKKCKEEMTYVCSVCNLKYESLLALFRHKKIQCKKYISPILQILHKCMKCNRKHKIFNLSRPKVCSECKVKMTYYCTICGKDIFSHAVIYRHVRDKCQVKGQVYFCNDCRFKATSQRQLLLHFNNTHQNLYNFDVECQKCGKGFPNHFIFRQHKKICGTRYYYCKTCPYRPRLRGSLRRHLQIVHKLPRDKVDKTLNESACPKNRDIIAEAAKSPEKVPDNETALKQPNKVTCHKCNLTQPVMYRQTSCSKCKTTLAFQCIYCPMRFRMPSLLQRHTRRMHGKLEYACNVCGKPFTFFGDYNDHQKWCGKEPRFECKLCSFKTKYRHNLKNHHDTIHDTNRPLYLCQDCGKEYKTERAWNGHLKSGCEYKKL